MTDTIYSSFAIIGLGTFGVTVALELARLGDYVLGIDIDERTVGKVADDLSSAIIADGRDEDALREAGIGRYDVVVVAIGEDLEANILCTMNAKVLGVKSVWVKASSRTHHRILVKMGADRVIQPEQEIGRHIAQMLHNPLVRDYVSLGNGFHVVDFAVPQRLNGHSLKDLDLENHYDMRCLGLMRGSEYVDCHTGDVGLVTDDKLLLLGRRQDLRRFGDDL